mgnify:CR=1 FL=1
MTEWLKKLNEQQYKAATHVNGPLFVIAGAGTGKTRTLTTRIAYLIEEAGILPESILAVTFTNKAAKEMKDRIVSMSGPYAIGVWVYTFHAFGVQVLRRDIEALNLGYTRNFNIIDEDDAKAFIRDIIKRNNLDSKHYKVNNIRSKISNFKHFGDDQFDDYNEKSIYQNYQKELSDNNLLDFDDLQLLTYKLLLEHEDIRTYYQNKFQYILVDEFQDTDHIQYQMMKLLSIKHKNLFVVGDPDQSIYAFRGANYENANHFRRDFGGECVLDINYRSTKEILEYANRLIAHNINRPVKKNLNSNNGQGHKPFVWSAPSDFGEATMIANEIQMLVRDLGYSYSDIAILYRNNALSRTFEDTLMKNNIPYVMYGGLSFYQRREIKDILAYIRLLINPHLDFYLKRIINMPKRSIGPTTLNKLEELSKTLSISMFSAITHLDVSGKTKESLLKFKLLIEEMTERINTMESLDEVVMYVAYTTGYILMLEDEKDDISEERIDNIKELKSVFVMGEGFYEGPFKEKLVQLLDQIALYSDLDKASNDNAVVLSTYHQVKGLEFKVVFMAVMEDQIFPSPLSSMDPREIEEERRIAYVGVTRAKERLYLTRSDQRLLYGSFIYPRASRFLKEMQPTSDVFTRKTYDKVQSASTHYLSTGDKVNHQIFGSGIVVSVEGDIATIAFKLPHGIKKILENHPSLKKES